MKRFTRSAMACMCLTLILCAGMPAGAQTVQTLAITDGVLSINGQEVPADELPGTLSLQGINATYTFIGDARPLIEIDGFLYVLDGQYLRSVDELRQEQGGVTFFLNAPQDEANLFNRYKKDTDEAPLAAVIAEEQAQALRQSKAELESLSNQVDQRQANEAIVTARDRVAQAAEVVQAFPQLQVQSYLSDVHQYDQNLYALLVREWRMEREAEALALEIRRTAKGARQNNLIAQLRQKLDEIFELKQQNRRQEIQQLEQELNALNERLQKREQWRDRLIDQRLSELIGIQISPGNR